MYERLGFIPEWTLTRFRRLAEGETEYPRVKLADARELSDGDWNAVEEIDAAAFGAARPRLLRRLAQDSRAVLVWPAEGRVVGWGMLRSGANADYLGPLACSIAEGSLSLVAALLHTSGSRPVIWDVPDQNEPAKTTAQRFGFVPLRPLTRMSLGPNPVADNPRAQFAIADPAVG